MATRKLKIALASTFNNPYAIANIYLDNVNVQSNTEITGTVYDPSIFEYTFEAINDHHLKITLENDFTDGIDDLNLVICYIALSDEYGVYAPYTYLIQNELINLNAPNNTLVTETLWGVGVPFELNFNVNNPLTFYDNRQYNIDNPPV